MKSLFLPRVRILAATSVTVALLVAGALLQSPAQADTAPASGVPATVSADGLPTVQINGVVWAEAIVGNIVYATGDFTDARPAGAALGKQQTPRGNLLAFNINTGDLITSFAHSLNAQGLAITASPDGSRVYVGGDFTAVDGKTRDHVAAFDTATGALDAAFAPSTNGSVKAVTASDTSVYIGGDFTRVGTSDRTRLAAISPTGSLQKWAPTADDASVTAMVLTPAGNRVIIGGRFTTINGKAAYGIGAVDATVGATSAWPSNFPVKDAGVNSDITSLTTDGTQVYGTGYVYGSGGNFEGTFAVNPDTGALNWLESCHGDSYGTYATGQVVYVVSHAHDCSDIGDFDDAVPRVNHRALAYTTYPTGKEVKNNNSGYANFAGQPDPTQLHWYPDVAIGSFTGQNQGAWSITGNSQYIVLGGEFPAINGVPQQGLVRMAISSLAPNKIGPISSTTLTPNVSSKSAGNVVVSWQATSDEDNALLTYKVYRDGASTPIDTVTASSTFWILPSLTFTDSGLASGSTHTYRITVTDPFGNTTTGATSSTVTVS